MPGEKHFLSRSEQTVFRDECITRATEFTQSVLPDLEL